MKPFHNAPGRNRAADTASVFDIPRAYYEQRAAISENATRLRKLRETVNSFADLSAAQWAQWYSVALGFQPDLILELGRGRGNSTALFTQAAQRLPGTRIVSLCMTSDWEDEVAPTVRSFVEPDWFAPLDARRADILNANYREIIGASARVLLLWDAHGFEIAEVVLSRILPLLIDREHVILLHDISDNRYSESSRSYNGAPLWKGAQWQERTGLWQSRTNIGWMSSIQNQVIALADFSARNDIEIQSADHEYRQFFSAHPERAEEMKQLLGDEFFSVQSHWAFLSLSGKGGPFHYPCDSAWPACANEGAALIERVDPQVASGTSLPLRFSTPAQRWLYGAVIYWTMPPAVPPAGVPVWLRLKLRVSKALAGVGLLNKTGSTFLDKRLVAPTPGAEYLYFPIEDRAQTGGIAIYTYDKCVPADIEVSELSVIW